MVKKFSERLKELRLEKGLSQRALAEKINCSQKIVDYWETGEVEPKASFISALADCFEVTCDYLLGREDEFGVVNACSNLQFDETELLTLYRNASVKEKNALLNLAKNLVDVDKRI